MSDFDRVGCRGDEAYKSLPNLVQVAADIHGDRVFIEDGDQRILFSEVPSLVAAASASLIALGVEHGDRVAIWAPNHPQWIIAALAIQSVGGALVPINTRYRGNEASYILTKSGAHVLITIDGFLDTDYLALLEAADDRPELSHRVLLEGASDQALGWAEFLELGSTVSTELVVERRQAVKPDDLCDILFTSGTTGQPKGVECTHAQTLRVFRDWSEVVGLCANDRYLVAMPFFHAFGYKAGWLACLMMGATVLPEPVFDPERLLRRVGRDSVSVLPGPPALYQSILARADLSDFDLSPLRLAVTGAAVIPVTLIKEMRDRLGFETVITGYGLTETSGVVTMCRHDDDPETIATTSGRAIPGVKIKVVRRDGSEAARGEAGEIMVCGYNVMRGYWDEPESTAQIVNDEGYLHTGDIGILDGRGYVRITDRKKDMVIVGGFNVYPAEIEQVLCRHEGVAQAAVIGVSEERLGEVCKAFVVAREGYEGSSDELFEFCRARIANFKVPRSFVWLDALPMNASGKVQKFKLRDRES